jgi:hypothetical protein
MLSEIELPPSIKVKIPQKNLTEPLRCVACAKDLGIWGLCLPTHQGWWTLEEANNEKCSPYKGNPSVTLFYKADEEVTLDDSIQGYCATYGFGDDGWGGDPVISKCSSSRHYHSLRVLFEDAQMWRIYAYKFKEDTLSFEEARFAPGLRSMDPPWFSVLARCRGCAGGEVSLISQRESKATDLHLKESLSISFPDGTLLVTPILES